ncbi:MAG: PilN domain-containing protein [Candidatus Aureabacteria bacterium]|nr:PilN domain-containing protein [Candidatus Auribacterota bacterium]
MLKINLLPEELREMERARKAKLNVALLSTVALVVGVVCVLVIFYIMGRRVSNMARVRSRLKELAPQVEEAESLVKHKGQYAREIEIFDDVASRKMPWSRILNDVSDAMPEDLFLVRMTYNSSQPGTLVIKGEALAGHGIESVVDFLDALRRSPDFVNEFSQIDYSIESIEGGRKSFEIKCGRAKREGKR